MVRLQKGHPPVKTAQPWPEMCKLTHTSASPITKHSHIIQQNHTQNNPECIWVRHWATKNKMLLKCTMTSSYCLEIVCRIRNPKSDPMIQIVHQNCDKDCMQHLTCSNSRNHTYREVGPYHIKTVVDSVINPTLPVRLAQKRDHRQSCRKQQSHNRPRLPKTWMIWPFTSSDLIVQLKTTNNQFKHLGLRPYNGYFGRWCDSTLAGKQDSFFKRLLFIKHDIYVWETTPVCAGMTLLPH